MSTAEILKTHPELYVSVSRGPYFLREIGELRRQVWKRISECLPSQNWINEHDEHGYHWLVFRESVLVASARLCIHPNLSFLEEAPHLQDDISLSPDDLPIAGMNRLVVLPQARRLGIARFLDELRIQKAKDLGAKTILAAPFRRASALKALGFQTVTHCKPPHLVGAEPLPVMLYRLSPEGLAGDASKGAG